MVGGDGAIYAIRRPLWRELPENAINDFLNPLQIVEAGWRAVYEPEAVCYEETAGGIAHRVPAPRPHRQPQLARGVPGAGVLNPLRVGLFSLVAGVAQDAALAIGLSSPLARCRRRWRCSPELVGARPLPALA